MSEIDPKFSAAAGLCFVVFSFFLRSSGLSLLGVVNIHNDLFKKALISTAGMQTFEALSSVLLSYASVFLALFFLVAGLALIVFYSSEKDDDSPMAAALAGSLSVFLFLGLSLMSVFLSAALIASSYVAAKQSSIYFSELKKWRFFRTGSRATGNALFAFNLVIAAGILVAVAAASSLYSAAFLADLEKTMSEIVANDNPALRGSVESRISEVVRNSSIIEAYLRWLPVLVAVEVWIILEFMRMFLSNIGGALTHFLFSRNA
ncbi:MAG: hypothetical protein HY517_04340 [Candidatus Aenigmarchaeota archaeon]|nr:hypothetical protein [Candidatus Aenigmarchaeota archaeon]